MYQAMRRIRLIYKGRRGEPLSAEEGRMLVELPGALGTATLGHVVKVAEETDRRELKECPKTHVVWRWSFGAAGYSIHSEDFLSEGEAATELRFLQRKLYPEWCETAQRRPARLNDLLALPSVISLPAKRSSAVASGWCGRS